MATFDSWVSTVSLEPGKRYKCSYTVYCLNGVPGSAFVAALAEVGILTDSADVTGPLSAAVWGSDIEFQVSARMSVTEFSGKLIAAFHRASENAWIECSTPEVSSVREFQPGTGVNPTLSFGSGAVFALVVVLAIAVFVWRAK